MKEALPSFDPLVSHREPQLPIYSDMLSSPNHRLAGQDNNSEGYRQFLPMPRAFDHRVEAAAVELEFLSKQKELLEFKQESPHFLNARVIAIAKARSRQLIVKRYLY